MCVPGSTKKCAQVACMLHPFEVHACISKVLDYIIASINSWLHEKCNVQKQTERLSGPLNHYLKGLLAAAFLSVFGAVSTQKALASNSGSD